MDDPDELLSPVLLEEVAAALIVAVLLTGWSTISVTAQEPTGTDQVTCPEAPVRAPGVVFSPTFGDREIGDVDFRCADLQGAVFDGLDLTQARLDGANLTGASFVRTDLGQADLRRAVLQQAVITETDMIQAHFEGADLRGARITEGTMSQAELPGANLVGATLRDVELGQANLTAARMAGVDASESRFSQADLPSADLTDAVLRDVLLNQTVLVDAVLHRADLTDAAAPQAQLTRADLTEADLTDASFSQADLSGADLTGAIVTGADFLQADLSGARIDEVIGASSPFPGTAYLALAAGLAIVALSVVGLILRVVRRRLGPVNPYDTKMTVGNTTTSFVLVPALAAVQAAGLYLLVCGVAGVLGTNLNPVGTPTGPPLIGDLAFEPSTIVIGFMLLLGGGIARSFARRF